MHIFSLDSNFKVILSHCDSRHDLMNLSLATEGNLLLLKWLEEEWVRLVAEIPQLPRLPCRRHVFFIRGRCRDKKKRNQM